MQIREVYFSEHPLCAHCLANGIITPSAELDHIEPIYKGGKDDWSNYQALCTECHKVKTANDMGHYKQGCDASGIPKGWGE